MTMATLRGLSLLEAGNAMIDGAHHIAVITFITAITSVDAAFFHGVAGDLSSFRGDQARNLGAAALIGMRTTAMEDATRRQIDRRRHLAPEANVIGLVIVQAWDRRHQRPGVGVARRGEERRRGRHFAYASQVHHRHPGTEMFHHR